MTPVLSDGVITLDAFAPGDVDAHLADDDPEQIRWLNDGLASTRASVESWFRRIEQEWRAGGPVCTFAVRDAATGQPMGMVEANLNPDDIEGLQPGEANISYGLYPAARGRGHATRAVGLLETFLTGRGVRRSVIRVDPANPASLAVPRRLGYQESGPVETDDGTRLVVFRKDLTG